MTRGVRERYRRLRDEGGARLRDPKGLAREIADDEGAQVRLLMFRALADPTRFLIVELLRRSGRLATTEIELATGVASSTVSHHLRVLETARLIVPQRAGGWTFWRVVAYPLIEALAPR